MTNIQYLEINFWFLYLNDLRVSRLIAEEIQRNNIFSDFFSSKDRVFCEACNGRNYYAQLFEKGSDLKN